MRESLPVPALSSPLSGELTLPGSKSHANRAIICACLTEGETVIQSATPCDDVEVMVENLKKMGVDIDWLDKKQGTLRVHGMPSGKWTPLRQGYEGHEVESGKSQTLDCHNAGTTLRFLVSLAASVPGNWTLTGDDNMRKRPVGDLTSALKILGADIQDTNGCPPVTVRGGTLRGGKVHLKASGSSQFLSSLLLVAPMLKAGLEIQLEGPLASSGYIDLTEKVMRDFGISIERRLNTFFVQEGRYSRRPHPGRGAPWLEEEFLRREENHSLAEKKFPLIPENSPLPGAAVPGRGPGTYNIEGDWSAAGAWLTLNALTRSDIRFSNLSEHSEQADSKLPLFIEKLKKSGDCTLDCSEIPDQVMNLAVLAAFRNGKTTMIGVANLRHKECDRLHVITTELKKAGVRIEEREDGVVVREQRGEGSIGTRNQKLETKNIFLDPHNDHRMAMAFAILGLLRGGISVKDPECVKKSYPNFFEHLAFLRTSNKPIVIVGMRGVGKSSLGRRLAARLGLKHVDSDHVFEKRFGPIREFVQKNGWEDFRTKEEEIVESTLKPGYVVSLGGGALISPKTRKLVAKESIVVWLMATEPELVQRLQRGKRPSLTSLPLKEEVRKLLLERGPQYREVAHIEVTPNRRFREQVSFVMRALRNLFPFSLSRSAGSLPARSQDQRRGGKRTPAAGNKRTVTPIAQHNHSSGS